VNTERRRGARRRPRLGAAEAAGRVTGCRRSRAESRRPGIS
jgi:hypothetical protein